MNLRTMGLNKECLFLFDIVPKGDHVMQIAEKLKTIIERLMMFTNAIKISKSENGLF